MVGYLAVLQLALNEWPVRSLYELDSLAVVSGAWDI